MSFSAVWGLFSPLAMEWEEEMGGGGRQGEQKCLLTDGILTELCFFFGYFHSTVSDCDILVSCQFIIIIICTSVLQE